jgi:hypothetical protein
MRKDGKPSASDLRTQAILRGDRKLINFAGPIVMWLSSALLVICGVLFVVSLLNSGGDGIILFGAMMIPLFALWGVTRLIPRWMAYVNKHYP